MTHTKQQVAHAGEYIIANIKFRQSVPNVGSDMIADLDTVKLQEQLTIGLSDSPLAEGAFKAFSVAAKKASSKFTYDAPDELLVKAAEIINSDYLDRFWRGDAMIPRA